MALADGLNRAGDHYLGRQRRIQPPGRLVASPGDYHRGLVLLHRPLHVRQPDRPYDAVLPRSSPRGPCLPGMPVHVFAPLMVYSIGLMGVITPYATGLAPVYFGSGFIPPKDFWVLGFVFGLIYLTTLLGVGIPYLLELGP